MGKASYWDARTHREKKKSSLHIQIFIFCRGKSIPEIKLCSYRRHFRGDIFVLRPFLISSGFPRQIRIPYLPSTLDDPRQILSLFSFIRMQETPFSRFSTTILLFFCQQPQRNLCPVGDREFPAIRLSIRSSIHLSMHSCVDLSLHLCLCRPWGPQGPQRTSEGS